MTLISFLEQRNPVCQQTLGLFFIFNLFSFSQPIKIGSHEINIEEKKPSGSVGRGAAGNRRGGSGGGGGARGNARGGASGGGSQAGRGGSGGSGEQPRRIWR